MGAAQSSPGEDASERRESKGGRIGAILHPSIHTRRLRRIGGMIGGTCDGQGEGLKLCARVKL